MATTTAVRSERKAAVPSHKAIIVLLMLSVAFLTLMPALYVVFHAFRWTYALWLLEAAFVPALLFSLLAGLLAYQRRRAHRSHGQGSEGE